MTILLYKHIELDERPSRHLRAWKAWHIVLYALAAICGVVNFVFLQNTMELVDNNCVLFPRELEFRTVELSELYDNKDNVIDAHDATNNTNAQVNAQDFNTTSKVKREATENATSENATVFTGESTDNVNVTNSKHDNETESLNVRHAFSRNSTHRLMLDTSRTLFESDNRCQFTEFMPIMSMIVAIVWITFFTMCPGGGRPRSGLQQPWTILMPALLFALVMVGLTGHNFTLVNKGLQAFCEAFFEVTNSTTCSSVNPFLERGWNASWGMGGRVQATRAASAGVLAAWVCVAALLLARCLAAPDFTVRNTGVQLAKDPQQIITRHLKSPRASHRSSNSSPTKRDTISVKSEPTVTTELVTASVEPGPDSAPSSILTTPVRRPPDNDGIEMTYSQRERHEV